MRVNKWLPVPGRKRQLKRSCLVADDTLIYLIGGFNTSQSDDDEGRFAQAYDPRSPAWLRLPNSWHYYTSRSSSCAINGKIYISNGLQLETFDHVAGTWQTICKKTENRVDLRDLSCVTSYENKLYIFGRASNTNDPFVNFVTYNPTSRMFSSPVPINGVSTYSLESIVFKSL